MYTLADERVMCVPLVVRTKLAELGIQPGTVHHLQGRMKGEQSAVHRMAGEEGERLQHLSPAETPPPVNGQTNGHAWQAERCPPRA
jgi:hypothetical protein